MHRGIGLLERAFEIGARVVDGERVLGRSKNTVLNAVGITNGCSCLSSFNYEGP